MWSLRASLGPTPNERYSGMEEICWYHHHYLNGCKCRRLKTRILTRNDKSQKPCSVHVNRSSVWGPNYQAGAMSTSQTAIGPHTYSCPLDGY